MFLRITNKTVSFTSCTFCVLCWRAVSKTIKQLLCLAVITDVWITIFAWTTFSKFLCITNLHDIISFKTTLMFGSQWLVFTFAISELPLTYRKMLLLTLVIKKQAHMTACVIQLLHFVTKNILHAINRHGCKEHQLAAPSLANRPDWR